MFRTMTAAAIAALLACGGDDGGAPAPPPEDSAEPQPPAQPPPEQPQPPQQPQQPPPSCQLAGSWSLSFTRTGSTGGVCGAPEFAGQSWSITIRDLQATRFSFEGRNVTRQNPISGTAILDPSTCDATISMTFEGPIARTIDGRPVPGRISSEFRLRFAGSSAVGDGQETFTSFVPLPSFPCTLTWRVFAAR